MSGKLELISFNLCPFVQRSVITLKEKKVDFGIRYIDLANKPEWFLAISPFGKVPLLREGETVLFESAVINEYLDEVYKPILHPGDPLRKAHNRAWIEFGSNLLFNQWYWYNSEDETAYAEKEKAIRDQLNRLEEQLGEGPFFNGDHFSLVDAAYAPVFTRFQLLEKINPRNLYENTPKVAAWAKNLVARPSVTDSVLPEFADLFNQSVRNKEGYLAGFMAD